MQVLDIDPRARGAEATAPLPWRWFDFEERARPAGGGCASVEGGGWTCAWQVQIDGRNIPFKYLRREEGAPRPTLMLLHGMGLTIATFRPVSGYLFATHDLVLVDYMGATDPVPWPAPDVSMKCFAEGLWRIADALRLERVCLGGNSLGGGLCLMGAILQPKRVERIVLANPACYPQELPDIYRIARIPLIGDLFMRITPARRFIDGVEHIGFADKSRFDPVLRRHYEENLHPIRNRYRMMQIIRQLPENPRDSAAAGHLSRLGELTCPVLISWGGQDPLLAPGSGHRLAGDLPNVVFDLYPELSHMPHEEAPERIGPRWAEFLGAHTPQRHRGTEDAQR